MTNEDERKKLRLNVPHLHVDLYWREGITCGNAEGLKIEASFKRHIRHFTHRWIRKTSVDRSIVGEDLQGAASEGL